MNSLCILIVDDEPGIRAMISTALSFANYQVVEAESGQQALEVIYKQRPDLILLDWMLPQVSGIEIMRKLKREEFSRDIPIIMLTAKATEENLVQGLKTGADDYITKPFSPKELVARIEAVTRRFGLGGEDTLTLGELTVNLTEHRVYLGDEVVELGPTEYKLLNYFLKNPNRAYSRTQLLDQVWGGDVYVGERTVDVHIRRLRKALSTHSPEGCDYGQLVETVRGTGYRLNSKGVIKGGE